MWFTKYSDILNCLGVDQQRDRQTDRIMTAIARVIKHALRTKTEKKTFVQ